MMRLARGDEGKVNYDGRSGSLGPMRRSRCSGWKGGQASERLWLADRGWAGYDQLHSSINSYHMCSKPQAGARWRGLLLRREEVLRVEEDEC